jgi:ribosomal protein S18 acetylase RimI-like enzyme
MTGIRRLQIADRPFVMELLASTKAFQAHELAVALELIDAALNHPDQTDYQTFLLESGRQLVAYACFGKNPMTRSTYDLYWLATHSEHMRQGHGRALFHFVEQEIRRQGGQLLVIETSSKDGYAGSRHFYRQVGCELAATLPGFYDANDDKLIYFKKLV